MIGKAQMVASLTTTALQRIVGQNIEDPGHYRNRESLMDALMRARPSVSQRVIVDSLNHEELRALASRTNYRVSTKLTDDELRSAMSGAYSSFRADLGNETAGLLRRIEALARLMDRNNCLVRLHIEPPASVSQVDRVQEKFGVKFPPTMRRCFLELSGELAFTWSVDGRPLSAPGEVELDALSDEELYGFNGRLSWNMSELELLNESRFCIDSSPVLPCFDDGAGNYLAFSADDRSGPVVWWSHEDSALHGHTVASNIGDLLSAWDSHYYIAPTSGTLRWLFADSNGLSPDTEISRRLTEVLGRP